MKTSAPKPSGRMRSRVFERTTFSGSGTTTYTAFQTLSSSPSAVLVDLADSSAPSSSPVKTTISNHLDESLGLIDHDFLTDMFGDPAKSEAIVSVKEALIDLNC